MASPRAKGGSDDPSTALRAGGAELHRNEAESISPSSYGRRVSHTVVEIEAGDEATSAAAAAAAAAEASAEETADRTDGQLLQKIKDFQRQREDDRKRLFRVFLWLFVRILTLGIPGTAIGHTLRFLLPGSYIPGVMIVLSFAMMNFAALLVTCVPHDLLDLDGVFRQNPKTALMYFLMCVIVNLVQVRFFPHLDVIKVLLYLCLACVPALLLACGVSPPRWWPSFPSIVAWYLLADGFTWAGIFYFHDENSWLSIPAIPSFILALFNLLYGAGGATAWAWARWRYRHVAWGYAESCYLVVHCWSLSFGIRWIYYGVVWMAWPREGAEDVMAGALEVMRGLANALLTLLPLTLGRKRFVQAVALRFDKDRRRLRRDGAFVAELLETVPVTVGQTWWVHRGVEDERYPLFHPERCWRRGVVVAVQDGEFVTRIQERTSVTKKMRTSITSTSSSDATTLRLKLPVMGEGESKEELLRRAQLDLRCVEFQNLSPDLMHRVDSRNKPELQAAWHALSRPVRIGERIDYFMSNSWYDNPEVKWQKLVEVAERFHKNHGRYPTFWLDKLCIDQQNITDGLKVLPVNVMACNKLLALCGNTYLSRLWCIWELFTLFAFVSESAALERVEFVFLGTHEEGLALLAGMANFHVSMAHCYDPNEEARLLRVIDAVGTERFNRRIANMAAITRHRLEKHTSKRRDGAITRVASSLMRSFRSVQSIASTK